MTFNSNFKKTAEIFNQRFYLLLEEFEKTFLLYKENEILCLKLLINSSGRKYRFIDGTIILYREFGA